MIFKCLESALTSKIKVESDLYIMANGHINCANEPTNTTMIQPPQQMPPAYAMKNMTVCEYSGVEIPLEYATDYGNPNHVNLITERGCPTIDGCAEFGDHHVITDATGVPTRNSGYVTHSNVDGNGYITNGNMRIPPEGMEATCAIVPQ